MVTTLNDHVRTWYIKYCSDNPLTTLAETNTFNKEFSKPKSDSQSIIGFKDIMMRVEEKSWEFYQRLKYQIREANMQITNSHHHK